MKEGREVWFDAFNEIGDRVKSLATVFQNECSNEDVQLWATEVAKVKSDLNMAVMGSVAWLLATKGGL